MRNVIKIVSSVSSAALLLSGAAMAAAPTGFALDAWTVSTTGAITATCPAGAVGGCAPLASGTGFDQTQFVLGGRTYIRTILAEGWAATGAAQAPGTLKFTDENLVQIGIAGVAAAQGLISKTHITEGVTPAIATTGFLGDSTIRTGWGTGTVAGVADPTRLAEVAIVLNVSERPALAVGGVQGANDFLSKFAFGGYTNATGSNVIDSLVMDQTIFLNALADKQRFVSSTKTAGTAPAQVAPAAPGFKFAANTDVPATYLTWTPTQQIQAIWVAQSVSNAGSVPGVAGAFSVSLLNNLATNTSVGVTNVTGTALATEFATGGSLASMFAPTPVF